MAQAVAGARVALAEKAAGVDRAAASGEGPGSGRGMGRGGQRPRHSD